MVPLCMTTTVHSCADVTAFSTEVRRAAQRCGILLPQARELAMVVTELGNNTVQHGHGGMLTVSLTNTSWRVSALDTGPGFPRAVLLDADHDGQGLASVRRLSLLSLQNCSTGGRAVASCTLAAAA